MSVPSGRKARSVPDAAAGFVSRHTWPTNACADDAGSAAGAGAGWTGVEGGGFAPGAGACAVHAPAAAAARTSSRRIDRRERVSGVLRMGWSEWSIVIPYCAARREAEALTAVDFYS